MLRVQPVVLSSCDSSLPIQARIQDKNALALSGPLLMPGRVMWRTWMSDPPMQRLHREVPWYRLVPVVGVDAD